MKQILTKKYWLIKRANWRLTKFRFFYNWKQCAKFAFYLFYLPVIFIFVGFPKMFFEWLYDFIIDNQPQWIKFDENPEWLKLKYNQKTDYMFKLKDWE